MRILCQSRAPSNCKNCIFLSVDNWNDFGFYTTFGISFYDSQCVAHDLGSIQIAFKGQTTETRSSERLYKLLRRNEIVDKLPNDFFSVGGGLDFYKKIYELGDVARDILSSLNDLVIFPERLIELQDEDVLAKSLLRNTSTTTLVGQYARILEGAAELTDYNFTFTRPETENFGALSLGFEVKVDSKPPTNIHALIGRNGSGKTTILNAMVDAITKPDESLATFETQNLFGHKVHGFSDFSRLISISFSAFDSFTPPKEQNNPAKGTCYSYIGLKNTKDTITQKSIDDLHIECARSLRTCFLSKEKARQWRETIQTLNSDLNFKSMDLELLNERFDNLACTHDDDFGEGFEKQYLSIVKPFLNRMSSGHAITFLTITNLVAKVEEKTLVLLDEPEGHLHPPLLSAFIRALSELLLRRNGVAIIATHSPVVLQEITKSCVWKIFRTGKSISCNRPDIETFGENVGTLTREVFGLEVEQSGFHALLQKSVNNGGSYQEILESYTNNIGIEGRMILKTLTTIRDKKDNND